MKIFRPGLPVTYVDEAPPVEEKAPGALPDIAAAMALAQARHVLSYTAQPGTQSPLIDNTVTPKPHSITDHPEVQK